MLHESPTWGLWTPDLISKAIYPLVALSNVLILITAATTIWSLLWHSKLAAGLAVAGACTLVIGGFTPVSYWLMLPLEDRFPRWKADRLTVVDGIIVLGGTFGEPIIDLVELARHFPKARLVYSGSGEERDAEILLKQFARFGGNRERVTMETRSRNTFENAVYSVELIKPNPNERWLLLTTAIHMPRAIGCFRRVGFKVEAYPTGYMMPQKIFGLSSQTLLRLDTVMKEWMALLVYRLTDRTNELFPAP
jgi:uncharacterized SAM-binding protein YcdF (DUF218 family)